MLSCLERCILKISCFRSRFSFSLCGPLPYVQCHITVNKNVLSVSLNKTFPSFFVLVDIVTIIDIDIIIIKVVVVVVV